MEGGEFSHKTAIAVDEEFREEVIDLNIETDWNCGVDWTYLLCILRKEDIEVDGSIAASDVAHTVAKTAIRYG